MQRRYTDRRRPQRLGRVVELGLVVEKPLRDAVSLISAVEHAALHRRARWSIGTSNRVGAVRPASRRRRCRGGDRHPAQERGREIEAVGGEHLARDARECRALLGRSDRVTSGRGRCRRGRAAWSGRRYTWRHRRRPARLTRPRDEVAAQDRIAVAALQLRASRCAATARARAAMRLLAIRKRIVAQIELVTSDPDRAPRSSTSSSVAYGERRLGASARRSARAPRASCSRREFACTRTRSPSSRTGRA